LLVSINSIIFAGSSSESLPFLEFLLDSYSNNSEPNSALQVLTKEPKIQQRKHQLLPNVVEVLAKESSLGDEFPVFYDLDSIKRINSDVPELGIAVSYGNLITSEYLNYPKHGWINVHFSLLPQYRGASPVQSALLSDDKFTGVTIFQLVEELDAGPIYEQKKIEIEANDNYGSLIEKLTNLGIEMLKDLIPRILADQILPHQQKGEVSYCHKFQASDRELKFEENIDVWFNKIRAFGPKPGAYLFLDESKSKTIKIIKAQKPEPDSLSTKISFSDQNSDKPQSLFHSLPKFPIAPQTYFFKFQKKIYLSHQNNFLEILEVQPSNKAVMDAVAWFNGINGINGLNDLQM